MPWRSNKTSNSGFASPYSPHSFSARKRGCWDAIRAAGYHIPDFETEELATLATASDNLTLVWAMTLTVRKTSTREEREAVRYQLEAFVQRWRR